MDLLMLDIRKPANFMNSAEPLYRLYACQSHVTYSRPQYVDGKISIIIVVHFQNCNQRRGALIYILKNCPLFGLGYLFRPRGGGWGSGEGGHVY